MHACGKVPRSCSHAYMYPPLLASHAADVPSSATRFSRVLKLLWGISKTNSKSLQGLWCFARVEPSTRGTRTRALDFLKYFVLFDPMKGMLAIVVTWLCIPQWTVSAAVTPVGAPSASMTHLIMPTAEGPAAAEASDGGYTAEALADFIDELPGWGKPDFDLYSGYAARCLDSCISFPSTG